jgi:preprotein translocase subunit SecF
MEIFRSQTKIKFMSSRRAALGVSTAIIVVGIVSLVVRGLNFGVDFTGGTLVEVSYDESVQIEVARDTLRQAGFDDVLVQYFGTSRDIMVRLPVREDDTGAKLSGDLMEALRKPYNETLAETRKGAAQQCITGSSAAAVDCRVQMRRVEFVGPQVGKELTEKGGLAMIYALIGILIYVAWRFEWRFAIGAVAALVHDVLVTLGLFSLLHLEFSLPVLAAILAVIGYSLNDTIVVFDRIRENFRKIRRGNVVEIMDRSINQTLPRTLLTSITTLLVLLALFILGGEVIHGFATALIIGVIVGTYSSIFVASPVVLALGVTREDMMPIKKEGADHERVAP